MPKPNPPKPYVAPKSAPKAPAPTFKRPVRPEADPDAQTRATDKPSRPFVPAQAPEPAAHGAVTAAISSPHTVNVGPTAAAGGRGLERRKREPVPEPPPPKAEGMVREPEAGATAVRVEVRAVPPSVHGDAEPPNHVPVSFQWPQPNRGVTRAPANVPALSSAARELARTMATEAPKTDDKK